MDCPASAATVCTIVERCLYPGCLTSLPHQKRMSPARIFSDNFCLPPHIETGVLQINLAIHPRCTYTYPITSDKPLSCHGSAATVCTILERCLCPGCLTSLPHQKRMSPARIFSDNFCLPPHAETGVLQVMNLLSIRGVLTPTLSLQTSHGLSCQRCYCLHHPGEMLVSWLPNVPASSKTYVAGTDLLRQFLPAAPR